MSAISEYVQYLLFGPQGLTKKGPCFQVPPGVMMFDLQTIQFNHSALSRILTLHSEKSRLFLQILLFRSWDQMETAWTLSRASKQNDRWCNLLLPYHLASQCSTYIARHCDACGPTLSEPCGANSCYRAFFRVTCCFCTSNSSEIT